MIIVMKVVLTSTKITVLIVILVATHSATSHSIIVQIAYVDVDTNLIKHEMMMSLSLSL